MKFEPSPALSALPLVAARNSIFAAKVGVNFAMVEWERASPRHEGPTALG
jgi:hypothetical protein